PLAARVRTSASPRGGEARPRDDRCAHRGGGGRGGLRGRGLLQPALPPQRRAHARAVPAPLRRAAQGARNRARVAVARSVRGRVTGWRRLTCGRALPNVVPAKAGTHFFASTWVPAFAGTTSL